MEMLLIPSCFPKGKISGGNLLKKGCPPDPHPKTLRILAGRSELVHASRNHQLVNISEVFRAGASPKS